jgi:hypothetical protein
MDNAQTAEEVTAILKDNYVQAEYIQWLDGFVTAYNDYVAPNGDITRGTDVDGMAAWLDTYCVTNPLDSLARASGKLIAELRAHPR